MRGVVTIQDISKELAPNDLHSRFAPLRTHDKIRLFGFCRKPSSGKIL